MSIAGTDSRKKVLAAVGISLPNATSIQRTKRSLTGRNVRRNSDSSAYTDRCQRMRTRPCGPCVLCRRNPSVGQSRSLELTRLPVPTRVRSTLFATRVAHGVPSPTGFQGLHWRLLALRRARGRRKSLNYFIGSSKRAGSMEARYRSISCSVSIRSFSSMGFNGGCPAPRKSRGCFVAASRA